MTILRSILTLSLLYMVASQSLDTQSFNSSSSGGLSTYSNTTTNPLNIKITYGLDWQSSNQFGAWFYIVPQSDIDELWVMYVQLLGSSQEILQSSVSKSSKLDLQWYSFASKDNSDFLHSSGKKIWVGGRFSETEGNPLPTKVLLETASADDKIKINNRAFIGLLYDIPSSIPQTPSQEYLQAIPPKVGPDMTKTIIIVVVVLSIVAIAVFIFVLWKVYRPVSPNSKLPFGGGVRDTIGENEYN